MVRGFCILAMIFVHLVYDLTELYPLLPPAGEGFHRLKNSGGAVFFLISGICATLGSRHLKRGAVCCGCGILVSAVSGFAGIPIRFGVLQALGSCMLLWHFFRRRSGKLLLFSALGFSAFGVIFEDFTVSAPFFYPLGLTAADFESADFFPLFPYLGIFLLGSLLGRALYQNRRSLFPKGSFSGRFSRFFRFCGRHSLALYLIHQPVLILLIQSAISTGG